MNTETDREGQSVELLARAFQGWTHVEAGHPMLEEGAYATDIRQIQNAKRVLAEARANPDESIRAELDSLEEDIKQSSKRKFIGNWVVPLIAIFVGAFSPADGGRVLLFFGFLYLFAAFVPVYIINRTNLAGKDFNDFGWIADRFGDSESLVMKGIGFVLMFLLLPVYAVVNVYRHWGDAIKIRLSSASDDIPESPFSGNTSMPSREAEQVPIEDVGSNSAQSVEVSEEIDETAKDAVISDTDASALLEEHLPILKEKVHETLQASSKSIDEYGAEKLFGEIHSFLPIAVRVVVRKKRFIAFCMKHKDKIS